MGSADHNPSATRAEDVCEHCGLRHLCLPGGFRQDELAALDKLVTRRRPVARGTTLHRIGDGFEAVHAIRRGSFKTQVTRADGRVQITGFRLPGELLGLDGLAGDRHELETVALEDAELCVLPRDHLERFARELPALHRQLNRLIGRGIRDDQDTMLMLGNLRAEERVAAFLVGLSERYRRLGHCAQRLEFAMTRREIGAYLGLEIETVSRALGKMAARELIRVNGKRVDILDEARLRSELGVTVLQRC